jgi:nucleotide-binding universal stress UspA family protein
MFRSLLVPLDGSAFGEHALPVAAAVARQSGAALSLAHVSPPADPGGRAGTPSLHEARAYLDGVAGRLAAEAGLRAQSRLLEGPVAEALEQFALRERVDLVVMTTHGRGPLSRLWLGSVADQLVHRLPLLILVRPQDTLAGLAGAAGPQHVLIALDGSGRAEAVLRPALQLAEPAGASLTLVRVVEPLAPPATDLHGLPVVMEDPSVLDRRRADALAYLERLADPLRWRLKVDTRVLVHAHPATALIKEAGARGCDVIALETRGRGGLPRLFLGSVADKVVRGAAASFLVHRTP